MDSHLVLCRQSLHQCHYCHVVHEALPDLWVQLHLVVPSHPNTVDKTKEIRTNTATLHCKATRVPECLGMNICRYTLVSWTTLARELDR